jgi:hypothetical protein
MLRVKNKPNFIAYNQNLPYIQKVVKKEAAGSVIEETNICVQGQTLKECKKIFDELNHTPCTNIDKKTIKELKKIWNNGIK